MLTEWSGRQAVVAERLRRLTRNQFPSGSVGSSPTNCVFFKITIFEISICIRDASKYSVAKETYIWCLKIGSLILSIKLFTFAIRLADMHLTAALMSLLYGVSTFLLIEQTAGKFLLDEIAEKNAKKWYLLIEKFSFFMVILRCLNR